MKRRKFVVALPAWGDVYVATALEVFLPMLFAPGNMPWLAENYDPILAIVTNDEGEERFKSSSIVNRLCNFVAVIYLPRPDYDDKYLGFGAAHQLVLAFFAGPETIFSFLSADVAIDANFYRFMANRIEDGYNAVLGTGPRTRIKEMKKALHPYLKSDGGLCVNADELSYLSLKHIHPLMRSNRWNGGESTPNYSPAQSTWGDFKSYILFSSFHLHPLVLTGIPLGTEINDETVDSTFLSRVFGDSGRFYYIENSSREAYICELSDDDIGTVYVSYKSERERLFATVLWCASHKIDVNSLFQNAQHPQLLAGSTLDVDSVAQDREKIFHIIGCVRKSVSVISFWRAKRRALRVKEIEEDLIRDGSVGIWGLGTDFQAMVDENQDFISVLSDPGVSLYDRERIGESCYGHYVKAPFDPLFSGRVHPTMISTSYWLVKLEFNSSFPKAKLSELMNDGIPLPWE